MGPFKLKYYFELNELLRNAKIQLQIEVYIIYELYTAAFTSL